MKVLICGDSFCVTDPRFPGLHWTEKLLNLSESIDLINLSYGGCSNALITYQLLQGLKLNPDFVILSFTDHGRYEYDKDVNACPFDLTGGSLGDYIKQRYTTNVYKNRPEVNSVIDKYIAVGSSENFEKLKNFFYIDYCLTLIQSQNIKFCYSLGGFEHKQNYTELINSNFIKNTLVHRNEFELPVNLWYHTGKDHRDQAPYFHVDDDKVQTLFANECFRRIVGD